MTSPACPSGLQAWANHNQRLYHRWDLSITGFIIYAHGPDLNSDGLDCYASFSPNGIVPSRGLIHGLHETMPVMRADHDINPGDPQVAAQQIVDRVHQRHQESPVPFHWFRNILKSPSWYVEVVEQLKQRDPSIELLDAPTFFELYRLYLQQQGALMTSYQ